MSQANEMERLRRALEAAEQRADTAEQRADTAEQRADTAEQRADTAAQQAHDVERRIVAVEQDLAEQRQRAGAAEILTQKTSLPEFLELCHKHYTNPLRIETDRSLTTQGSHTKTQGKKHPTFLEPWHDFPQLQQHYFDEAYRLIAHSDEARHFTPRLALQEEGQTLCSRALTSEKDLEHYERSAIEDKVKQVLVHLQALPEARDLLRDSKDVEFHNHLNALGEAAQTHRTGQRPSVVDQACLLRRGDGNNSILLLREYKAAHKLTVAYLRAGLRPMNVREEVVQRITIPTDPTEKLRYNADRLVAAAVTQTFDYMIDQGLEYSSIATGPAEVFLRVPQDRPDTVQYYLTEPLLDVSSEDEYGFRYPFTAVSRLLGFSLTAMQSANRSQYWIRQVSSSLHRWDESFEEALHQIPSEERLSSPNGSLYSSPPYPVSPRSPYLLRNRRPVTDHHEDLLKTSFSSHSSSDGPDDGISGVPDTPSRLPSAKRKRRSTNINQDSAPVSSSTHGRSRAFCSMNCMAGIRYRRSFDTACPNYVEHQKLSHTATHQLDRAAFSDRVRAQLDADMDHNCEPLNLQGSRGVLFKVTLASHGYTFVAKGTVDVFRADLLYEGTVYERLLPAQGCTVAVHLGNIDPCHPYYYDVGVKITHMLLLSWGGCPLAKSPAAIDCEAEKRRSLGAINQLGVIHGDPEPRNLLWNDETQRVVVIDFEDSHMIKRKRRHANTSDSMQRNIKRRALVPERMVGSQRCGLV